jgi:glutaredoxin-related protein
VYCSNLSDIISVVKLYGECYFEEDRNFYDRLKYNYHISNSFSHDMKNMKKMLKLLDQSYYFSPLLKSSLIASDQFFFYSYFIDFMKYLSFCCMMESIFHIILTFPLLSVCSNSSEYVIDWTVRTPSNQ